MYFYFDIVLNLIQSIGYVTASLRRADDADKTILTYQGYSYNSETVGNIKLYIFKILKLVCDYKNN